MLSANKSLLLTLCLLSSFWNALACPSETVQSGTVEFVLEGKEEGARFLRSSDSFTKSLNPLNRQVRAFGLDKYDDDTYLNYLGQTALCWTSLEKTQLKLTLDTLRQRMTQLGFAHLFHQPIRLIKTNGKDEMKSPYVRNGNIIIPKGRLNIYTLSHELFHVLTVQNPHLKDSLYSLIAFKPMTANQPKIPKSIAKNILVNPDTPTSQHYIEVRYQRKSIPVVPVVTIHPYTLENMEELVTDETYAMDSLIELKLFSLESGELILAMDTNYERLVGGNTTYFYHPEEVMAENFALLLRDSYAFLGKPELPEKLKTLLAKSQTTGD
jgi:hypothetical protein